MRILYLNAVLFGIALNSAFAHAAFEVRSYLETRDEGKRQMVVVLGDFTHPHKLQLLTGEFEPSEKPTLEIAVIKAVALNTDADQLIFNFVQPEHESAESGDAYLRLSASMAGVGAGSAILARTQSKRSVELRQFVIQSATYKNILVTDELGLGNADLRRVVDQWKKDYPHLASETVRHPVDEIFDAPLTPQSIEKLLAEATNGNAADLAKIANRIDMLDDVSPLASVLDVLIERGDEKLRDFLASNILSKPSTAEMDPVVAHLIRVGSANAHRLIGLKTLLQPHGESMRQAQLAMAESFGSGDFSPIFEILERPASAGDFELLETMVGNPNYDHRQRIDSILKSWKVLDLQEAGNLNSAVYNINLEQRRANVEKATIALENKMKDRACLASYGEKK